MKKLLFTFVLTALAIGLCAQTGLFGISFDQKQADVEKMLKGKGFKVEVTEDGDLLATNPKIKQLTNIEINLSSSKQVSSWSILYDISKDDAIINEVEAELLKLHGGDRIFDDYYEEWMWELDNEMGAYMYEDGEILRVSYYEFDYSVYDYMW